MKKLGILFLFGLFLAINSFFMMNIVYSLESQTYDSLSNSTHNRLMPAYCSKRTGCYA